MNIFVLNTGRCGSTTFYQACQHIGNFSCSHESRSSLLGDERLSYPSHHIEVDNRLAWILGRLDRKFGNDAIYVHLNRKLKATVDSFMLRQNFGIMDAYRKGILMGADEAKPEQVAQDYCDTINSNIELFLNDKQHKMNFTLEDAAHDWPIFWQMIQASGDQEAALAEFHIAHNASGD